MINMAKSDNNNYLFFTLHYYTFNAYFWHRALKALTCITYTIRKIINGIDLYK